jgi:heat shock protein HtpX
MAAYGLYTHIAANRRRSVLLIAGLFLQIYLLVFAGSLVGEVFISGDASLEWLLRSAWVNFLKAAPFATIGTILWILIAYKFHQSLIDAVTGGREVTRQEQPRLWNLLENLCISRGIPMPALKVMDTDALNAFASGLSEKQYAITVTSGLLQRLNDKEVEAVLGHELTHIRNGDVRMMVIAVIIAGVIGFFAEMFFRIFFQSNWRFGGSRSSSSSSSDGDRKGSGGAFVAILLAVALVAIAWLLSVMIRFALSRSREYLADAGSVELTKNPDAMIMALRKIENRGELEGATSAVMELCVDNPREGFVDLFATHPSVDSRVKALMEFAGGHDPGPLALPDPSPGESADDGGDVREASAPHGGPWDAHEPRDANEPSAPAPLPPGGADSPWGRTPLPDITGQAEPGGPAVPGDGAQGRRSPWDPLTRPFGRHGR